MLPFFPYYFTLTRVYRYFGSQVVNENKTKERMFATAANTATFSVNVC